MYKLNSVKLNAEQAKILNNSSFKKILRYESWIYAYRITLDLKEKIESERKAKL